MFPFVPAPRGRGRVLEDSARSTVFISFAVDVQFATRSRLEDSFSIASEMLVHQTLFLSVMKIPRHPTSKSLLVLVFVLPQLRIILTDAPISTGIVTFQRARAPVSDAV